MTRINLEISNFWNIIPCKARNETLFKHYMKQLTSVVTSFAFSPFRECYQNKSGPNNFVAWLLVTYFS